MSCLELVVGFSLFPMLNSMEACFSATGKKKITSHQTFSFLDSELQDTNSSLHLNNKKKFTEVYIYILICSREKS